MARPMPVIAAGRLDHGLAGLELTCHLCRLDDAKRQAILDRAQRVESLDLDVEVDAFRSQPIDPDHRRIAHRLTDIVVALRHSACPRL